MKASRRHELKSNTLALGLQSFPEAWRKYGGKVLLALVVILAVVLFIRYRANTAQQQQETAGESYALAVQSINSLQNPPRDPKLAMQQRREIQDQAERAISQVLETGSEDALKAEALVARGDLNWTLARLPAIPAAATQQSGRTSSESRDDLLESARKAYEAALAIPGAKPLSITTARLALATIAEERKQWDQAKKQYETIRDDPRTSAPFKTEATSALENLAKIQTPILLGTPATLPAFPEPEGTRPTTAPSTAPTTGAAPPSQPQSKPTTNAAR